MAKDYSTKDELAECITLEEWELELINIIHEYYQSIMKVIRFLITHVHVYVSVQPELRQYEKSDNRHTNI